MRIEAYIIHLQRAKSRAKQVAELQQALPIPSRVIDAIDGQKLTVEQRHSYIKNLYKPSYPFALRNAEIACFHSHIKAWQTLLDSGNDAALIIEDDVKLDMAVFSKAFELAKSQLNHGYIRFPCADREKPSRQFRLPCRRREIRLFLPKVVGLGMQAQLVSRTAATQLLSATRQLDRPVDTFLQMHWHAGVSPQVVYPCGTYEHDQQLGGSTIKGHKSLWQRLHREIMRPIYRHRIQHESKRYYPV